MNRSAILAAAVAASLALPAFAASYVGADLYTLTVSSDYSPITPDSTRPTAAAGFVAGNAISFIDSLQHGFFYTPAGVGTDLHPAGYHDSAMAGVYPSQQVGNATVQINFTDNSFVYQSHAMLWSGTAASAVDLDPDTTPGLAGSYAFATNGTQQVGTSGIGSSTHASLWSGTAASHVDLHPLNFTNGGSSYAYALAGSQQVGYGTDPIITSGHTHSLLWNGSAASAIDLHPTGFTDSVALGASETQQVGYATGNGIDAFPHAILWNGSSASAVDLSPTNLAGFNASVALATNGTLQVGYGSGSGTFNLSHALLWSGSGNTAVDLQLFLSSGFVTSSATAIDSAGDVFGIARDGNGYDHAVEWLTQTLPTWRGSSGNDWSTNINWQSSTPPGTAAQFNAQGTGGTVNINAPRHLATLVLNNSTSGGYTLAPGTAGKLFLDAGANQSLVVVSGNHVISAPVEIDSNTTLSLSTAATTLTLSGTLSAAGSPMLTLTGEGTFVLTGNSSFNATTLIASYNTTMQFGNNTPAGVLGNGPIINNGILAFNRSDAATFANALTGSGILSQMGSGTSTLTNAANFAGTTLISAGSLHFGGGVTHSIGDISGDAGDLQINAGSTLIAGELSLPAVTICGTLILRQNPNAAFDGSIINTLTIAGSPTSASGWTGKLDLVNNTLILQSSSTEKAATLATLADQIRSGNNAGTWIGNGITSSTNAADTTHNSTLALIDKADLPGHIFAGQSVNNNSIIITRALLGDADLSGTVDLADFDTWFNHNGFLTYSYAQGDWNNDGIVDLADFDIWFNHNGFTGLSLTPESSPIPEPATAALLLLALPLLAPENAPPTASHL